MKNIAKAILVLLLTISFYSCRKEHPANIAILAGKWKLTETLQDPGDGSGKYTPVAQKSNYDYVEFGDNGKLTSTVFTGYVKYKLKDSLDVAFYKADSTIQYYRYQFHDGVLDMSPNGPIRCYEPCGNRFVKVNN